MPDSIPTVSLLVQVRPDRPDSVLIVARDGFNRSTHLGAMSSEDLIKTARLFLAAAVGEETVAFILSAIECCAESADDNAAADLAWHVLNVMRPVEAVTA